MRILAALAQARTAISVNLVIAYLTALDAR